MLTGDSYRVCNFLVFEINNTYSHSSCKEKSLLSETFSLFNHTIVQNWQ